MQPLQHGNWALQAYKLAGLRGQRATAALNRRIRAQALGAIGCPGAATQACANFGLGHAFPAFQGHRLKKKRIGLDQFLFSRVIG